MPAGRELFKLFGMIGLQGVENVETNLKKIDKQVLRTQRAMNALGNKTYKLGKSLSKSLTVPLIGIGAVLTKISADFDGAFKQSLAIMGDVSDAMQADMRKAAIEVSKSVDVSAKKAAESYYYLASAGLSAAQQLQALPKVAKFAQAGMFEMARATDLLTDAQSALGLSSKDTATSMENMQRVSDVLVKANTLANASVEQFSESITNKAGAALRLLNKDVEEGLAVLAAYADQGLKGAAAGESLNITLRDLQRAALGNEAAFKKAGVQVFDQNGKMRNMADIVQNLENLMIGMSDKQKRSTLTMLGFTDKSVSATMALLGTSNAIREYEKQLKSASGITDQVANNQLKSFWKQLGLIKNRLVALALEGDTFERIGLNVIIPVLDKLVSSAEKLVSKWRSLNDTTKKTIGGFVLLLAAIGPVTMALGKLIAFSKVLIPLFVAIRTGTLSWSAAMATLSKSLLGMTIVITSLVAVGWYFYSQWENISKQLITIWNQLKLGALKIVESIVDVFTEGLDRIFRLVDKFSSFIPGLSAKIKNARIGILKFRASLSKLSIAQAQNLAVANAQSAATEGFLASVKKAIQAGKEKLGLTKEDTTETKKQTQVNLEALKVEEDAAKKKAEAAKQLAKEKLSFEEKLFADINSLKLTDLEQLQLEHDLRLEEAKRLGADIYAVEELYHLKKLELRKKEIEEEKKNLSKNLSLTQSIGYKANNIFAKFSDNKIKRIDNEEKRRIQEVQNSQMAAEQKEIAIQKIQAEMDKRRQAAEKASAWRERAAALFSIALNTARAIVEALPNIPLSVTMGVLGGAQAAAVLSEPMPLFDGAMIEGSEKGMIARMGENNQDELALPLEKGIELIVDGILTRLSNNFDFPSLGAQAAIAGVPSDVNVYNLNVGTLIGDEQSYKKLERRMANIRIAENQRKGE